MQLAKQGKPLHPPGSSVPTAPPGAWERGPVAAPAACRSVPIFPKPPLLQAWD